MSKKGFAVSEGIYSVFGAMFFNACLGTKRKIALYENLMLFKLYSSRNISSHGGVSLGGAPSINR